MAAAACATAAPAAPAGAAASACPTCAVSCAERWPTVRGMSRGVRAGAPTALALRRAQVIEQNLGAETDQEQASRRVQALSQQRAKVAACKQSEHTQQRGRD